MVVKIKSLKDFVECVRAQSQLLEIEKQLESFSEWHSQFYFEDEDYEYYIDGACKSINEFSRKFKELAELEIEKDE